MTLRVDDVTSEKMSEFHEKYKDTYECIFIADETADETGKQHMQGFIGYKEDPGKKYLDCMRKNFQNFFNKKGTQLSFTKVKKHEDYAAYVMKQHNVVINIGVPEDLLELAKYKQEQFELAKAKKAAHKNPLLALWEWFEPQLDIKYEQWKSSRLNVTGRDVTIAKFIKQNNEIFVRHVIIWYGRMANKSFCRQRMAEAALYLEFKSRDKYYVRSKPEDDKEVVDTMEDLVSDIMGWYNSSNFSQSVQKNYFD